MKYFVCSPRSMTPVEIPFPRLNGNKLLPAARRTTSASTSTLTGLNRFTLSHCGSHTPLPTLKPHLAVPAPRLSIDCLLNFIEMGLSPLYISSAELAHPPPDSSVKTLSGFLPGCIHPLHILNLFLLSTILVIQQFVLIQIDNSFPVFYNGR